MLGLAGILGMSCAVRRAPAPDPRSPCPALRPSGGSSAPIRWLLRQDADERSALDAWCWGVGPVVFVEYPSGEVHRIAPPTLDSLVVVVWNTNIGKGDLDRLIDDLRSGRLTGRPAVHFALLLQEVHRTGAAVPADVPDWVATANAADGEGRADIARFAERHRLSLLYAPSMRSGDSQDETPGRDRGNAILSTLPLEAPTMFELPWERQRRVAVLAQVEGRRSDGEPWSLRLASAHLDNRARFGRIHRSFGSARERQAAALAEVLADDQATALGADLNTWLGGANATATRVLRETLPLPETLPAGATAKLPGPIPDLQLDYLLFRIPEAWSAGYHVAEDAYGSDHRPLVGWIDFTARASTNAQTGDADQSPAEGASPADRRSRSTRTGR